MAQFLVNTVDQLKDAAQVLMTSPRLAHDTETKGPDDELDVSGLFPFHGARSFSHIIANATDEYYFDFNSGGINPKYKPLLQPLFDDQNRIWFYCNAIFDNTVIHFDGLKNEGRIFDCPSIARVDFNMHDPTKRKFLNNDDETFLSLEYLAEYYGVKAKDDRVKKYIIENNLYSEKRCRFTGEKIPLYHLVDKRLMFEYGCGDGRTTYDLGQKIIQCLNYKDEQFAHVREKSGAGLLMDVARNESRLTSVLIDMKIEGMKIDRAYCEKVITEGEIELKTLTSEVQALVGDINLNSGPQIAKLLLSKGIELPRKEVTETAIKRSKAWHEKAELARKAGKEKQFHEYMQKSIEYGKGNYTTDSKTLKKVLEKYPDLDFLSKLNKAKKLEKKLNTYFKNFLIFADKNGYIHANLNQEKAITGRFSSSMPNLQNLHKEKWEKDSGITREEWKAQNPNLVRSAFINDDPENFDLFFFDYDQQEMMVMLDQAEELSIIEKLIDKIYDDFYLATGAVLLEVAGIKITRQQAKALALGLAYGQGVALLAKNLGMDEDTARKFIDDFFKVLPQLKKLKKRLENSVKWYGRIHNPYGRVSYIDKNDSYKALNSFVQGTSADITKTAMVLIYERLNIGSYKSKMLLPVHDELIFKIHKSERFLIAEIRRLMSEAYPHKHIPLGTGVEYSPTSWGDKDDYNEEVAA